MLKTVTECAVIGMSAGTAILLFRPALRNSALWRATVTPLASIIGSGFLIMAPVLGLVVGNWAVVAIAGIVTLAYAVGSAVRYNIRHVEALLQEDAPANPVYRLVKRLERAAKFVLVLAYVIAVTFYLELLGAFVLRAFDVVDPVLQKTVASVLLVAIACWGAWRGLTGLEFLEKYAVDIKLVVIGGLLAALLVYNADLVLEGGWALAPVDHVAGFGDTLRRLLGAFLVVQGFETSRYLGKSYSPELRARSMRYAQWISAGIYVAFVGLATVLLPSFQSAGETAIIDLSAELSRLLPWMLILGAAMSQFSAAVADTISSGGLVEEATNGKVSRRRVYVAVAAAALVLLWTAPIFVIVAWASRAFALYYALQCSIAAVHSARGDRRSTARVVAYGLLALAMIATAIFAVPAEAPAAS